MQIIQPPILPKRRRDMHKGDAGRVCIIGGGRGMLGATILAGEAALRGGAGLVTIATDNAHMGLPAVRCPELMTADALQIAADAPHMEVAVLGPGLGMNDWGGRVFARFIGRKNSSISPIVIDADGLNWLARAQIDINAPPAKRAWILTPHAGEAARLLQCTADEVQADRENSARAIAAKFGGVCILKGAGALVAGDDGELLKCDRGNPGMATAGMGDVLAGLVAGLWVQNMGAQNMGARRRSAKSAAAAAVWLHATAADRAAVKMGARGLLARDVIRYIAPVIHTCETRAG